MNLNAALDVITGLVLMYLVLSLFCTTINEFIASLAGLRARTLRKTLQQLIDDPTLKKLFDDHGLIDGASVAVSGGNRGRTPTTVPSTAALAAGAPAAPAPAKAAASASAWWRVGHPSYISADTVASAMTSSLLGYIRSNQPLPVDATFKDLEDAVKALPVDSNIRDTLSACLVDADGRIDNFRTRVAAWFDDSMDRLSGSYKRNLQLISLAVGLALAVAFNADTLNVAHRLWSDRALAEVISQTAGNMALAKDPLDPKTIRASQPQCSSPKDDNDLSNDIATMCALNADLRPLPIGWDPAPANIWWALLGWIITAIALTQGAPFWFDLLQKIMQFRATGTKPKKAADPS